MITVSPLNHRDKIWIKLDFDRTIVPLPKIQTLPNLKYSRTHYTWYIPYDTPSYKALKNLGYPITINIAGTIQHDNTTIDEKTHLVNAATKIVRDADIPEQSRNKIVLNNQNFQITIPYDKSDVLFLKNLERSYWNKKYELWVAKATVQNLCAIQDRFSFWTSIEYEKIFELISITEDPMKVTLYTSPQNKDVFFIQLSGYKVDTEFIKNMPGRSYDKTHKRWLVPNKMILINRIIDHYRDFGVKVINKIPKDGNDYNKANLSLADRKNKFIQKLAHQYRPILSEYIDILITRRSSWNTISVYSAAFIKYVQEIGVEKVPIVYAKTVTNYLSKIAGQKVSNSKLNQVYSALQFYYDKVIYRPDFEIDRLKRPKNKMSLPRILSTEEVERVLMAPDNLKHTTLLFTIYSSGLRLNELLSLKVDDILWERNQIFVKNGKGGKDRVVGLSQVLKELLELYFHEYKPEYWLFEGQNKQHPYSSASVQKIVKAAATKAGITKRVSPHLLRHCFATHLMDEGVGIRYIQELLGHKDIKTTLLYTHVSNTKATGITSPLDKLFGKK